MKKLYIVRHAKSSWKFKNVGDHDRPLNNRGFQDALNMGKKLHQIGVIPNLVISSSALRALTTAKLIAEQIGYSKSQIETIEKLFHARSETIMNIVSSTSSEISSLMIFGHNPGFTSFSNEIGNLSIHNIPTCGIVCLQLDIEDWTDIKETCGKFIFYEYPKKIKLE